MLIIALRNSRIVFAIDKMKQWKGDVRMDELSTAIGKNIRKYRKLKGLTLEKLAEIVDTETNYLGQCERGERRFSLDKLIMLIEYFGVTANDIIPVHQGRGAASPDSAQMQEITRLLADCTENQLAVVQNILKETIPFLKE